MYLVNEKSSDVINTLINCKVLSTRQSVKKRVVNVQQVVETWKQTINSLLTHTQLTS